MFTATDYTRLNAAGARAGSLQVVIETPQGSRNKFKYDEGLGLFILDRVLPAGSFFPYDFGFVPSTRAEDGDPLDVLVFLEGPAFPGCVLTTRLIGVLEAEQCENRQTVRNDRLFAVLDTEHNPARIQSVEELRPGQLDEIDHFFISYNRWAGRTFKPLGRHGPKRAWKLVKEGGARFAREDRKTVAHQGKTGEGRPEGAAKEEATSPR